MNKTYPIFIVVILALLFGCKTNYEEKIQIYGWRILTDRTQTAIATIEASKNYKVNQLQLSNDICNSLRDVKKQWNRNIVNTLTKKAHDAGIPEVLVWDQALYDLNYYPERFRLNGLLNLDDPEFWRWLSDDYNKMLDKIPEIDGIVLTLNDSDNKVEDQFSVVLKLPEEKLAAFIDSLASVVVIQRNMKLYLRGNVENEETSPILIAALSMIKSTGIEFMAKEPAIDFWSPLPVSEKIREIPLPVIIDFDCTHENEGQGNVASLFPEVHLKRWKYYVRFPNVIGFSVRTDSYGRTSILTRPPEVNLFAIYEATKNPDKGIDEVLDNYLLMRYDTTAAPFFKTAFELAPDIILSTYFTLGLSTSTDSRPDFDFKPVPDKTVFKSWLQNPVVHIQHNVNMDFNYWSDLINHLAPAENKIAEGKFANEFPDVFKNNLVQPEELMDTIYLNYILTEKQFGIDQTLKAIAAINEAKPYCTDSRIFNRIYHTFSRTLLAARLRKAYAQVYYAKRIWNRGEEFQTENVRTLITTGVEELEAVSEDIKNYRRKGPVGSYEWENDADLAMKLVRETKNSGILVQK